MGHGLLLHGCLLVDQVGLDRGTDGSQYLGFDCSQVVSPFALMRAIKKTVMSLQRPAFNYKASIFLLLKADRG
jgi:hypothetical protein